MCDMPLIFNIKTIVELIDSFIKYNNLLDCNKYLKNLKSKRYFSKRYSLRYCNDVKFREYVCSIIPPNQISLNLHGSNIRDVSMLSNIYALDLTHCHYINVVSMLGRLHKLNLLGCNITDISMLGRVHKLILSCCSQITDVSMLGNIHTLFLDYCSNVSDVSMLGNVKILNLSCSNVKDVSMLGNVHTLNLSWCNQKM